MKVCQSSKGGQVLQGSTESGINEGACSICCTTFGSRWVVEEMKKRSKKVGESRLVSKYR